MAQGRHLVAQPHHISQVIDYILTDWPQRGRIDPSRIGMFGYSAGGFTALVIAGANPDLAQGVVHCHDHPAAWDCLYLKKHGFVLGKRPAPTSWHHDPRAKAIVMTAPCCGYMFELGGLADVHVPISALGSGGKDIIVDDSPALIARLLPQHPEDHVVPGAGRPSCVAPCSWSLRAVAKVIGWRGGENFCAAPTGFDRGAFHRQFDAAVVAFFTATLPARTG